MTIQITVKAVTVEAPAGKKYSVAEVVYADSFGETKAKKLMSFANPATYATLKDAKNGEVYDITQIKNDKGYLDWTSAAKAGGEFAANGANASTAAKAADGTKAFTRSSYETAEERAARQVLIVKQSCLAQAVARVDKGHDPRDIVTTAQFFVDWVFDKQELQVGEGA